VNYDALHVRLVQIVETTSFNLLERLCSELMEAIFDDPRVARAEVTIAKPDILDGTTPAITLTRENPRYRASFP
jgi:dihydroneopterin aldolase